MSELVCAFSGVAPTDAEIDLPFEPADDDPLDDLPLGWSRVTIETRTINPRYAAVIQARETQIQAAVAGLELPEGATKEDRVMAASLARISVEALFAAMEERTPPYIHEETELHLAPPSADPRIAAAWRQLAELLGIAPKPRKPKKGITAVQQEK